MQIDWLTVAAQIVNFLVLVWLLHRFLYGPIVRAMERREARIRDRLSRADEKEKAAEAEAEDYRRRKAELDERRAAILEEARREAKETRERLVEEAREEVAEERRAWHRQVEDDREAFIRTLREGAARHVGEVARAALAELADAKVEGELAARFTDRLAALDDEEAEGFAKAARQDGGRVRVESAFDLPGPVKSRITRAVHERLGEDLSVEYRRDGALLLGIRLGAGGRTLEWSLAAYLDRLEEATRDKLAEIGADGERAAA